MGIGGMMGSAIFIFTGSTGMLAGPSSILAWLTAGVLMMAIALCYTELAIAFPKAGGPAVYPYETFGKNKTVRSFFSYLEGICFFLGWTLCVTISGLGIAYYLAIMIPGAAGHTIIIAITAILLCYVINLLGVTLTGKSNLILTAILLCIIIIFIASGISHAKPASYHPFFKGGGMGFVASVALAVGAFGAWTGITTAIEEVKEPEKNVPRAILLSLIITTIIYTLIVIALHGTVDASEFVEGNRVMLAPLGYASEKIGYVWLSRYLLPMAAVIAIFTTMLIGVFSIGRIFLALGRSEVLPKACAKVSKRFKTPWVGLTIAAVASIAFACFPQYFFKIIVVAMVIGTGLPYGINIVAFIRLRHYRKDVKPTFRAPGGYALPAIAFVVLGISMIGLGLMEIVWSLIALAIIGLYFVIRYFTHPEIFRRN
jgi:Gamma-aminobutyrate permease and related permeases